MARHTEKAEQRRDLDQILEGELAFQGRVHHLDELLATRELRKGLCRERQEQNACSVKHMRSSNA